MCQQTISRERLVSRELLVWRVCVEVEVAQSLMPKGLYYCAKEFELYTKVDGE